MSNSTPITHQQDRCRQSQQEDQLPPPYEQLRHGLSHETTAAFISEDDFIDPAFQNSSYPIIVQPPAGIPELVRQRDGERLWDYRQDGAFRRDFNLDADVFIRHFSRVTSRVYTSRNLHIFGESHVSGKVDAVDICVQDGAHVTGNLDAEGEISIGGSCQVSGDIHGSKDVLVCMHSRVSGRVFAKGDLIVKGYAQISGDVEVRGDLVVSGYARITGRTIVKKTLRVLENAYVAGHNENSKCSVTKEHVDEPDNQSAGLVVNAPAYD